MGGWKDLETLMIWDFRGNTLSATLVLPFRGQPDEFKKKMFGGSKGFQTFKKLFPNFKNSLKKRIFPNSNCKVLSKHSNTPTNCPGIRSKIFTKPMARPISRAVKTHFDWLSNGVLSNKAKSGWIWSKVEN
jgi:hypothetical protein